MPPQEPHILNKVYNVAALGYAGGAKGDGVADDRAAIQAAIDQCIADSQVPNFGFGVVNFPPGTYKVSRNTDPNFNAAKRALNIGGSNVWLMGQGKRSKLVADAPTFSDGTAIFVVHSDTTQYKNIVFSDLAFDGTGTTSCAGIHVRGRTTALPSSEVTAQRCYFEKFLGTTGFTGRGFTVTNNHADQNTPPYYPIIVDGCYFDNNYAAIVLHQANYSCMNNIIEHTDASLVDVQFGVYADLNEQNHGAIVNNYVTSMKEAGIYLFRSSRITVSGNYINQSGVPGAAGDGIRADGAQYCIIDNNMLEDIQSNGIWLKTQGSGQDTRKCLANIIANNAIVNTLNAGASAAHGIYLGGNQTQNVIEGNRISGARHNGIFLDNGADENVVRANLCLNNNNAGSDNDGIRIRSSNNNLLTFNRCWDDRAGGQQKQRYGIAVTNAGGFPVSDGNVIMFNDVRGNKSIQSATSPALMLWVESGATNTRVDLNVGYKSENGGLFAGNGNAQTYGIAHSLDARDSNTTPNSTFKLPRSAVVTPASLQAVLNGATRLKHYVTTTRTNVMVNYNGTKPPGGNNVVKFYWTAEM